MRNQTKFLGMTRWEAVMLLIVAAILALILSTELPRLNGPGGLPNRSICSANIRGIVQAMIIYAQTNHNSFPCVPAAAAIFVNGLDPAGAPVATGSPKAPAAVKRPAKTIVRKAHGLAGSPLACLWLLVTTSQVTPESFICPADPAAVQPSAEYALSSGATTRYYLNFGMDNAGPLPFGQGESYSFAYPWSGQRPAPWWNSNATTEAQASALPLVSDMAPMQDPNAPGRSARDVTQPLNNKFGPYIFNSANHGGDGQNVGFGDDHVAFYTNPYAGIHQYNIFSCGGSPAAGGGTPISPRLIAPEPRISEKYPFDIIMVPTRNVQTGRW